MKNFTQDVLRAAKTKSLQVCKDRTSKQQKQLKAKHLNEAKWLMVRQQSSLKDNEKKRLQIFQRITNCWLIYTPLQTWLERLGAAES